MEEQKIMSPQVKGLIISLIVIVLGIAGYVTEVAFTNWYNWVVNAIMLVAIVYACVHFANQKDGYVTFGNVFLHGFKITAVCAIIILIYTLLSMTVIFPEAKQKIFDMQQAAMEEKNVSEDQIEAGMAMMKKWFMLFLVLGVIFGTLVWGCIASLIGAAVAKKKKMNPLDQLGR